MRHRVKLKRIVDDITYPKATPEEKTPIWKTSSFSNNGAIVKDSAKEMDPKETAKTEKDRKDLEEGDMAPEKSGKMSLARKFCFVMSFNGSILYALIFAWLLPCQRPGCLPSPSEWKLNMSNSFLTTSLETVLVDNPQLVIFGYTNEDGKNLTAVDITSGTIKWSTSSDHVLKHVFCDFDAMLDVNFDGSPDCVVTAYNYIAVINPKTGETIWQKTLSSSPGERIHKVRHIQSKSLHLILGIGDKSLFLYESVNGWQLWKMPLPCSWPLDVKIAGPWSRKNETSWALSCEYGDSIELYSFSEDNLLDLIDKNSTIKFDLLFSHQSGRGSIGGDVIRNRDALVLSWADRVAMVTLKSLKSDLVWNREFSASLSYPLFITNIVMGHFTNSKQQQLAVVLQEGEESMIHVIEIRHGTSILNGTLGTRNVISVNKISGKKNELDSLFMESVHYINHKEKLNSTKSRQDPTDRTYFTIQFSSKKPIFQNIFTEEDVYDSTFVQTPDGISSLLFSKRDETGNTIIKRYVTMTSKVFCDTHRQSNSNTSDFLLAY